MKKSRLLELTRPSMIQLVVRDLNAGVVKNMGTIEEYCEKILHASREEIEEIIGMDIDELERR